MFPRTLAVLAAAAGLAIAPWGAVATAATPAPTVLTAPTPAAVAGGPIPLEGPPCPEGYLCVFEGAGFTGPRLDLVTCSAEPVDLRSSFGRSMGSFINNQTGDQVAEFYAVDDAGNPVLAFSSTAVDAGADTSGAGVYFAKPC